MGKTKTNVSQQNAQKMSKEKNVHSGLSSQNIGKPRVSRRFFRLLKIRLSGRYELLKSVHRRIVIDMLYESIKMFRSINEQISPQEFNDTMNKAQLNYLKNGA